MYTLFTEFVKYNKKVLDQLFYVAHYYNIFQKQNPIYRYNCDLVDKLNIAIPTTCAF